MAVKSTQLRSKILITKLNLCCALSLLTAYFRSWSIFPANSPYFHNKIIIKICFRNVTELVSYQGLLYFHVKLNSNRAF